jgi:hypothetical protein
VLLAGSINLTPASANAGSSGSNRKKVWAGSTGVEFFRREEGRPLQDETAWALFLAYLAAGGFSAAGESYGDADCKPKDNYELTDGYA